MKKSILHTQFMVKDVVKENGKTERQFVFKSEGSKQKFQYFMEYLKDGQTVDVFYDANKDNGTLGQLAKIHACIRQIAMDTGDSFIDTKLHIKRKAGLCVSKTIDGEKFIHCKSFGDCSIEELNFVIETIKQVGEVVGINFH